MLPETRKDCPDCGEPLPLKATRCRCGWKARTVGGALVPAHDPFLLCCEWVSNGRCHYMGAHSSNLNGTGPWYCLAHYHCTDAAFGAEMVEQSHRDIPKPDYSYAARRAKPVLPRPTDNPLVRSIREAYLRSNAARVKVPEHITPHVDEALERIPGQDDEERAA